MDTLNSESAAAIVCALAKQHHIHYLGTALDAWARPQALALQARYLRELKS